jgi:hypothetical protein
LNLSFSRGVAAELSFELLDSEIRCSSSRWLSFNSSHPACFTDLWEREDQYHYNDSYTCQYQYQDNEKEKEKKKKKRKERQITSKLKTKKMKTMKETTIRGLK